MLSRAHRFSLRTHPDFFNTAHKVRGSYFMVLYQQSKTTTTQAAFVATKKNFPTAVARNKIKRQLRALLSPLLLSDYSKSIVVTVYRPLDTDVQRQELLQTMKNILGAQK